MERSWIHNMDNRGETPVSRALKCSQVALGDLVLSRAAVGTDPIKEQTTLLHRVASQGDTDQVRQCIEEGENPDCRDFYGETPLHKAAREAHLQVVEFLATHGADINGRDNYGLTPLHWTVLVGSETVAAFLLDSGADVNARDYFVGNMTPLALAKLMGYNDLAQLLSRHGGTV
ncbi:MAG: ankyrin repeat domain-containing protein [Candidatus Hydrogenedentota bacterium]